MKIYDGPQYEIRRNPVQANRDSIVESARLCYRNVGTGPESDSRLIRLCVKKKHWTPIEMGDVKVRFIFDRAIANEAVRHRLASFNQESTRYCNYSLDKFGHEICVVKPVEIETDSMAYYIWKNGCERDEKEYFDLLELGVSPETARGKLPHSLAATIDIKANLREWHHIMELRTDRTAHPDFRIALHGVLIELARDYPEIFKDLLNERNPQIVEDFAKKGNN